MFYKLKLLHILPMCKRLDIITSKEHKKKNSVFVHKYFSRLNLFAAHRAE